ncbi:related to cellobiose dehydrogenase [Rhynchosporium agropyri]|uniref:Related to cellobiose dehydrogenase n=1 Tax=Rhynchosporium agropyri TaxID=914238 RepID=A0A1E1JY52_9HELO|nr:related to cellobiose dehydrogenase [Rhynchosporium agropyri]
MRLSDFIASLAFVSSTIAQKVTYCASGNVCYAVNVPEITAQTGKGDIFFQMSGPSTMSWIGLGQGNAMSGSNIFMIYANAAGNNVTLAPRLGVGNRQPVSGSTAQLTLLSGSGIMNGQMIANVRCSNCNSWTGGSMSLNDAKSEWIWSYKTGEPISSDSTTINLAQHSRYGVTTFNLQQAAGGNSVNPFAATVAAITPNTGTNTNTGSTQTPSGSTTGATGSELGGIESTPKFNRILIAHAIIGPIAFVIFYPLGAMTIRLLSFKGLVWMHAGWMVFTYLLVLISMGLGVWLAVNTKQLDTAHAIIGLVVVGSLLLQPITGLLHHLKYKKVGRPNAGTYPHIWWGRAVITLGMINGGIGLQLAGNTEKGEIAYGVVAGIIWCVWIGVTILAFLKSRNKKEGESGETVFGGMRENNSRTRMAGQDSPTLQGGFNSGERPMSQESTVVAESFYRGR